MKKLLAKYALAPTLCALGALCMPLPAQATVFATLGFDNITANNVGDAAIGEAQLSVTISDYTVDGSGGGLADTQVLFTFFNIGPAASSITDIYFDDGTLLDISSILNSTGVDFTEGASPGNLPGGNGISFETTAGFLADSAAPTQPNGVNPGEQVSILFDLLTGVTLEDTIAALAPASPGLIPDLRIGIHVQGFASGGSESFVNGPPTEPGPGVPVPAPLALLGFGGLLLGWTTRKQRRHP